MANDTFTLQFRVLAAQRFVRYPVQRGCQCAGPYAQRLLSLSHGNAQKFENELIERRVSETRVCRLSFPYFTRTHQVEYICRAIINIAQYGWRLLPL